MFNIKEFFKKSYTKYTKTNVSSITFLGNYKKSKDNSQILKNT